MKKILVVGAAGYFGSLLVEELLKFTTCSVILAGRDLDRLESLRNGWESALRDRTQVRKCDLSDPRSIDSALDGASIAVCAAGPFQSLPKDLLPACLRNNVHYVDLSDDRDYVMWVHQTCEKTSENSIHSAVCTGWSAVPALSALLASFASEGMDDIDTIRIQIAPGNKAPRSYATVASLLDGLGKPFKIYRDGEWITVTGWTEPACFHFPQPVGSRTGYLVDVPDHQLFPSLFTARTVEFRVGAEISPFNYASCMLAKLTSCGLIKSWTPYAKLLQGFLSHGGWLGHDHGAVGVECTGSIGGEVLTRSACVLAEHRGHYIPVMPAAIMCSKLASGDINPIGLVQLNSWLQPNELEAECARRNYKLVVTQRV